MSLLTQLQEGGIGLFTPNVAARRRP